MDSGLKILSRNMEEEISRYGMLLEELKKEAEVLRGGTPEMLAESVQAVSEHIRAIQHIHGSIRRTIEEIRISAGCGEKEDAAQSDFFSLLPAHEAGRLRSHQCTLDQLKKWVLEINTRNKSFIQSALAFGKDLLSIRAPSTFPQPGYAQTGKRSPFAPVPVSLDRKV